MLIGLGWLRLRLGSGHGLWEICQVTFTYQKKKKSSHQFKPPSLFYNIKVLLRYDMAELQETDRGAECSL